MSKIVPFDTRSVLGVSIVAASVAEVVPYLIERLVRRERTRLVYANSNLLTMAHDVAPGLLSSDFLILNDGIALDLACRFLYGGPFPDNLNGSDMTPRVLANAPLGSRVFLYGARPIVVARAAEVLAEQYGVTVCGATDGYGTDPDAVASMVNAANADILLVALGNPKQEQWISKWSNTLEVPFVSGVGAYLDFAAGAVPRAPALLRAVKLEWAWRLALEPTRLFRRYTIEMGRFAFLLLAQKRGMSGSSVSAEEVDGSLS